MKPRLVAYAGVQLRDFLLGRVPALLLTSALATWGLVRVTGVTLAVFDPTAGVSGREQARLAFANALGAYALLGAVFAAQGLVARDRWRGFDRVLFSRPLSPIRYYSQGFVVAGVVVVGVGVLAAGLFAVAAYPVSVPGVAGYIALAWISVGAFAFVLSTLTTYHLPLVVGALGASLVLDRFGDALRASGASTTLVDAAQYVLPPAHVVAELRAPFASGVVVSADALAWPLAFGVLCLALAVLVLHRRPFRP